MDISAAVKSPPRSDKHFLISSVGDGIQVEVVEVVRDICGDRHPEQLI